jgi:hypothetical protein
LSRSAAQRLLEPPDRVCFGRRTIVRSIAGAFRSRRTSRKPKPAFSPSPREAKVAPWPADHIARHGGAAAAARLVSRKEQDVVRVVSDLSHVSRHEPHHDHRSIRYSMNFLYNRRRPSRRRQTWPKTIRPVIDRLGMITVHTCQTFAQAGFKLRLRGPAWSLLSFLAPCFVRCAAKIACLAVLRCTLLEILDLLAQPLKLKKSRGKVVRRYGWFW